MNQSESIAKLALALCRAQSAIEGARKDSNNPFFKSKYADLASVTAAIREPFCENELAYTQTTSASETGPTIVTTLMHSSGEWIRGELFIPAIKCDPQQFGSAMTYGRRYALAAIAGVVQEDDDGNAATHKKTEPQEKRNSLANEIEKMLLNAVEMNKERAADVLKMATTYQKDGKEFYMEYSKLHTYSDKWLIGAKKNIESILSEEKF